jgi:2-deoxy-D-gluconate 3-dehydrogenase
MAITSLFDLAGRRALVTGASRGLGAAAATALAEAGASVILLGREIETLRRRAEELASTGARTAMVVCDMGDREQVERGAAEAIECFGGVDILVNNAGIIRRSPAETMTSEDWSAVLEVNLTGVFLLSQRIGRRMIEQGSGKIINIASLLSFSGGLNVAAYTASKSGIAGLTRALANEWGKHGVNVNAIAPGYFRTDATLALQQNPERYNALLSRIPMGRWGEPEDLKGSVLFLASRASDYINGHILTVDGGWMAA